MRIIGFGFRGPKNRVPGLDVAGTVVEVGSTVTRFAVGDEVFGISRGSFAEFAAAREDKLATKPPSLTFEQAAVVPVSGLTALQAIRDAGRLQAGQRVLVIGASGGVGSYAVQIAKALGGQVTGVASTAKLDLVRALGADHVIDYTVEDFADGTHRYDLILDIGGNSTITRLRRALTAPGTLVIVGGENGGNLTGGIGRQLRAVAISPFLPPAARHAHHQGASQRPRPAHPAHRGRPASLPAWSGPSRWNRCPTPCVSSHPARCAARWPSPPDAEVGSRGGRFEAGADGHPHQVGPVVTIQSPGQVGGTVARGRLGPGRAAACAAHPERDPSLVLVHLEAQCPRDGSIQHQVVPGSGGFDEGAPQIVTEASGDLTLGSDHVVVEGRQGQGGGVQRHGGERCATEVIRVQHRRFEQPPGSSQGGAPPGVLEISRRPPPGRLQTTWAHGTLPSTRQRSARGVRRPPARNDPPPPCQGLVLDGQDGLPLEARSGMRDCPGVILDRSGSSHA